MGVSLPVEPLSTSVKSMLWKWLEIVTIISLLYIYIYIYILLFTLLNNNVDLF
jgi:hypothetical protein